MLDFFCNISLGEFQWTEIVYAVGGSFIGIFVPLFIEKRKDRRQKKEARKKLLFSLNRELDSILQQIEENKSDIFSFTTFVWQSSIAAGMLPDMLADKSIQGELLIEIYSELSLLQELHNDFCQCTQEENLQDIWNSITQKRNEIYTKIAQYRNSSNIR
ncbi:MAG: hypothetical protein IKJ88_03270 [Clostridia bacterium]|nr:hypothetical protein [Clostridia bacterium]